MSTEAERRVHLKLALRREFYAWAAERVRDRSVLDLGCGDGSGADVLAGSARWVLAVDRDPRAVASARAATSGLPVAVARMDAHALGLADGSVEAVVAIAFLEYVERPLAALDEAVRVLAPGGLLVCTTTNAALTPKARDGSPLYRDHVEELTAAELRRELERRLVDVTLFGARSGGPARRYLADRRAMAIESLLIRTRLKHAIPIRVRNFFRRLVTGVDVEDVIAAGFQIVEEEHEDSIYVTGIGRKPGA